ncbi:MAG TPA: xanthine dehydrogenase family protein molybdopterin-binding subunit [Gemmatimonadaceae bacterium]|nr:xanthine dehydrogenase family protein molybdopterin-binding subunit [Gemmatimonadaceae bacterium]
MGAITKLDRRDFLKLGAIAGGGLLLGAYVPDSRGAAPEAGSSSPFQPNVFLRIDTDDTVTIWVARSEMGQGVRTALPMIVADELDADWSRVRIEQADAHPSKYGRMMTVGSTSVRGGAWMPLRQAGAAARAMLMAAAAARFGVRAGECRTERGRVLHDASGRSATYGELAEAAAALRVPARPPLKDPSAFRLIGTSPPLVDTRDKVTGRALFGADVRVPGMLFATVVHPPVFGGRVASFDASRALRVSGVRHVVEVSQGVAVVADGTWAAFRGARALDIRWNDGAFAMSTPEIFGELARLAERPGAEARREGDASAGLARATRRLQATYEAPYLAHATMEPMNCTADVRADRCEIWVPTQNPQGTQSTAARLTGLPVEAVTVHVTHLGCGWGRRSRTDFVEDAVETSMKVGAPVQLVWTREEDMQHDFYRPAAHHRLEGGLDADGRLSALHVRIAAQAISGGRPIDGPAVASVADTPYAIPNLLVEYCRAELGVPVGYWRSVGPSQNTFILESFIDELAHAAGRDPVEIRREMLGGHPRLAHVLELAARESGWGTPAAAGRARGVALVEDKGGLVAEVAEVSIADGRPRVHRVTVAADCGRIIHPGIVEAQLAGSVVAGLTAALYGEITIERGRAVQGNFDGYRMLRMGEMPQIGVHIVQSAEEPGGVGEPAVPPIAPAVTNALFALTGQRIRRLPIVLDTGRAATPM